MKRKRKKYSHLFQDDLQATNVLLLGEAQSQVWCLTQGTSLGVKEIITVVLKHNVKHRSGQARLRNQLKLECAWGRMTRKVIIRMENFTSEKKGKQFDSFSVTYLTPCWGKYRKWRKMQVVQSYRKQRWVACKAGMINTVSVIRLQRVCPLYLITFGFPVQIIRGL